MIGKVIKNDYILSLLAKVVKIFIGLLATSFLTRYLGIVNKGEYTFINQVISVCGLIFNFGIYQSYAFYYKKRGPVVFNKYISITLFQFIVYIILGGVISVLAKSLVVTLICITLPFQVMRMQMDNIMLVQNVRSRMQSTMLFSVASMFANLVLLLALYLEVLPSSVIPAIIVVILMDSLAVIRYFVKERENIKFTSVDFGFAKEVLKFGYLPMLSALLVTLNYRVDIFFLKNAGVPLELSLYAVAAGIMNYMWLIPDAFKDVLFSRVARNNGESAIAFSVKFSLAFLLLTTIGFAVFGKLFISLMFGDEFLPSYDVTMVLFLGVYSMIFYKMFGIVMLAEGKRVPYFLMLLASVILNVVLNYILIPDYGMYGAAYASVGSYNLCGIMFLIYFSKSKKIPIKKLLLINKGDIENMKAFINRVKGKRN